MGRKVKLTITESRCRSEFHKKGEEYIIDDTTFTEKLMLTTNMLEILNNY